MSDGYIQGILDRFIEGDQVSVGDLNEVAAALSANDPEGLWAMIIKACASLKDVKRQEEIGIAILEILAEEPVHELWLKTLPHILSRSDLRWMIFYAYRHQRHLFFDHLMMAKA